MKLSFEDFIIKLSTEERKKSNPCHAASTGQFCSTGGSGGFTIESGQEVANNLADRFNMPRVKLKEGLTGENGEPFLAARVGLGNNIEVNSKLLNDPSTYDPKYTDAFPRNANEVISHEYGHVIHVELSTQDKYWEHGYARPSIANAHNVEWGKTLSAKQDGIAKREGGKISDYATKNGEEYFAEAFSAYIKGPSHHSKINPDVLKVFKDLDTQNK